MKEGTVDSARAIIANDQAPEIPQPADGALDDPSPPAPPQRQAILCCGANAIALVWTDQFDAATPQPLSQWIAIVSFVGNHSHRLLARPTRAMSAAYADRRERRFRKPNFRRGCRVKLVSQRNTLAVDHHQPFGSFPTGALLLLLCS